MPSIFFKQRTVGLCCLCLALLVVEGLRPKPRVVFQVLLFIMIILRIYAMCIETIAGQWGYVGVYIVYAIQVIFFYIFVSFIWINVDFYPIWFILLNSMY
jgi:hypothetical protein